MLKMKIQIFFEQEANTISSIKIQTDLFNVLYTNVKKFDDFKLLKMNRVHVNWSLL